MLLFNDPAGSDDISCLALKAAAFHHGKQFFHLGFRHGIRVWPAFKHGGSHLVYLLIGALSRQHSCHKHLIRIGKHQFRLGFRIHFLQLVENPFLSFLVHVLLLIWSVHKSQQLLLL